MVNSKIDFNEVIRLHKKGEELVGIIQRMGGTPKDYQKAYNLIKFGIKPE